MKKTILVIISLGLFSPTYPISMPTKDQVASVLYIAAISAGTYVGLRLLESWWCSQEESLDETIRNIVKTVIIQHKVVTHHEIEESVARVLQGKYPHLTRERIRKMIQQIVAEEVAPIAEQTSALETKVQQLLDSPAQELEQVAAEVAQEASCCGH